MDDLISRQEALDLLSKDLFGGNAERIIANMPTAQPEVAKDTNVPSTDCISRQAAIDLLKQMRKDGDMVPWEGKDVFARIRKLPSAQPEQQWIPCKDRLPEIRQEVLLCDGLWYFTGEYCGEFWYIEGGFKKSEELDYDGLAWMPLPEPYKED